MTLKVNVNAHVFNDSQENLQMHVWCIFDYSSSNHFQVIAWTSLISKNSESNGQNYLIGQGRWLLFSIPDKTIPWCMFGANLVIPAQIWDELLRGQAEFPRILCQTGQNDFEGQYQWPLFSIPAESKPWCTFGANVWILAQICDEFSCGQGKVHGRTDGRTDGQTQATTQPLRPESSNYKLVDLRLNYSTTQYRMWHAASPKHIIFNVSKTVLGHIRFSYVNFVEFPGIHRNAQTKQRPM